MNDRTCRRCGGVLGPGGACPRCQAETAATVAFERTLPDPPLAPAGAEHWRPLASAEDLPAGRRHGLALAAALVEAGTPVEDLNRFLLLVDAPLAELLVECGDLTAEIVRLAEAAARADACDPVLALVERGFETMESRGRLALRAADVPDSIGPFAIVCRLGRGGMGEVLLGCRPGLEKEFAVKRIRDLDGAGGLLLARFRQEVHALARLRHPNIVPLADASLDGPEPWFAMEFVAGIDLTRRIRSGLTIAQAVRVVAQVARALDHAHRHQILHRDLKPGNVAIDGDDEAYLMDFGLARVAGGARGLTVDLIGTPHYIPPETFERPQAYSSRSDLYSLGVVLFESLTGRRPFEGRSLGEWMGEVRRRAAPAPSEFQRRVPPELDALCGRLLAVDPRERPESARAVAEELDAIAASWKTRQAVRRAARPSFVRGAVAGGVIAIGIVAAVLLGRREEEPAPPANAEPSPVAVAVAGAGPPPPPAPRPFRWEEPRIDGPIPPGTWGAARETTGRRLAYAAGVSALPGGGSTDVAIFWILEPVDASGAAYRWRAESIPTRPRRRAALVLPGDADEYLFFGGYPGPGWTPDAFDDTWTRSARGEWTPGPSCALRDYEYLDAFPHPDGKRIVALVKRPSAHGPGAVIEIEPTEGAWRCTERADLANPRIVGSFELAFDRSRGRAVVVFPTERDSKGSAYAIEELDPDAGWTRLRVEPDLGSIHRITVAARNGCVAISCTARSGGDVTLLAGRVESGTLRLSRLPEVGKAFTGARLWIDETTGHLLHLGSETEWSEPPRVHAAAFDALEAWLDRAAGAR